MAYVRNPYQAEHYGNVTVNYPYYNHDMAMVHDDVPMFSPSQSRHQSEVRHIPMHFNAYDSPYYPSNRLPHHGFEPVTPPAEDHYSSGSYSTGSPTNASESCQTSPKTERYTPPPNHHHRAPIDPSSLTHS